METIICQVLSRYEGWREIRGGYLKATQDLYVTELFCIFCLLTEFNAYEMYIFFEF
jgi:hypothetical protein